MSGKDVIAMAATNREREATIAYLMDRAEQYDNSSNYRALFDELISGLAEGRHVQCHEAGEYDDLRPFVARVIRSHRNA